MVISSRGMRGSPAGLCRSKQSILTEAATTRRGSDGLLLESASSPQLVIHLFQACSYRGATSGTHPSKNGHERNITRKHLQQERHGLPCCPRRGVGSPSVFWTSEPPSQASVGSTRSSKARAVCARVHGLQTEDLRKLLLHGSSLQEVGIACFCQKEVKHLFLVLKRIYPI